MKKIGLFLLLLIVPLAVKAEVDYNITDYYISSEVEIAGGIKIKELLVLDGTFNGYQRDIIYKNSSLPKWEAGKINFEKSSIYGGSSLENLRVATFKVGDNVDFKTMQDINSASFAEEVSNASLGDRNVYTIEKTDDGENIKMYSPSNNGRVAFYLEYVITNAVVMHNDVAELYYPYIGDKFSDPIGNVQVQVILPYSDTSDNFRIWAHGPLTGEIKKYQNEDKEPIGVLASAKNLQANTGFDIRLTFDKSLIQIPDFMNHSNEDALAKIIAVEEKRADEANAQRAKIRLIYYSIMGFVAAYIAGLIALWIYIYIKHDREYQSDFKGKYYRDFIEDYDVEVIDYLLHRTITPNAMSASIMNLIYKKNIEVTEIAGKKKNKEYKFILKNKDNLSEAENYLIDFLFTSVGDNNEFTTKDLQDYANSSHTYSIFTAKYQNWKNKIIAEGQNQHFYENKDKIKTLGISYSILGIIIFIISMLNNVQGIFIYLMIIPIGIFLFYTISFNKRTKKGNDDYAKWMGFKNFLNDFGTFETKELPEIALWERYMVYAVIFGVADKVQKAMNVKIKEYDPNNPMYAPYMNSWLYYDMHYHLANTVHQAVTTSINAATAHSVNSSGSGFGGGFSSGSGGGFGGGGGGHGF